MKILLYQGVSILSRLIRWQTRSEYSHAAIELFNGEVIESWRKGVTLGHDFGSNHTRGTVVDRFEVIGMSSFQQLKASEFCKTQLGKKYDLAGVARFVTRRDEPADDKWFCSELVCAACEHAGFPLLHLPPSYTSPRDVSISPYLKRIGTRITS